MIDFETKNLRKNIKKNTSGAKKELIRNYLALKIKNMLKILNSACSAIGRLIFSPAIESINHFSIELHFSFYKWFGCLGRKCLMGEF